MIRLFLTTAWLGSNTPFEHTLPNGETALVYQTLLQAYNDADAEGDIIQPAPPGTPGFCFYDASGEPLQTVTVNLAANWLIDKAITLQGGWCRLRLDGGNKYRIQSLVPISASDVDFICFRSTSGNNYGMYFRNACEFTRCVFSAISSSTNINDSIYFKGGQKQIKDSVFLGLVKKDNDSSIVVGVNTVYATRCTGELHTRFVKTDCINVFDMSQDELDATFVKPPVASLSWDAVNLDNVDLRLLPTSPYATGGTSVTSGQEVYDLAGNRRKPGGALGAYEVLDDVTAYCRTYNPGLRYVATKSSDSAPDVLACYRAARLANAPYGSTVLIADSSAVAVGYRTSPDRDWVNTATNKAAWSFGGANGVGNINQLHAVNAAGEETLVQMYNEADAPVGALRCKMDLNSGYSYQTATGGGVATNWAPTSSTVCYMPDSADCLDSNARFGKLYVAGWARPKLGNAEIDELELGLGAVATTSGSVTLKNKTGASDEVLSQLVPVAPARITFKECVISDSASE